MSANSDNPGASPLPLPSPDPPSDPQTTRRQSQMERAKSRYETARQATTIEAGLQASSLCLIRHLLRALRSGHTIIEKIGYKHEVLKVVIRNMSKPDELPDSGTTSPAADAAPVLSARQKKRSSPHGPDEDGTRSSPKKSRGHRSKKQKTRSERRTARVPRMPNASADELDELCFLPLPQPHAM